MTKRAQGLSPTEWRIMNALWRAGAGSGLQEIYDCLDEDTDWQINTVQTFLQRCVKKGYLTTELVRGRRRYTPTLTRERAYKERARMLFEQLVSGDEEAALEAMREVLERRLGRVGRRRGRGDRKKTA